MTDWLFLFYLLLLIAAIVILWRGYSVKPDSHGRTDYCGTCRDHNVDCHLCGASRLCVCGRKVTISDMNYLHKGEWKPVESPRHTSLHHDEDPGDCA